MRSEFDKANDLTIGVSTPNALAVDLSTVAVLEVPPLVLTPHGTQPDLWLTLKE